MIQNRHVSNIHERYLILWGAVLIQAVIDYLDADKRFKGNAERFICSRKNVDFPSFIGICEILEICPDILREKIVKLGRLNRQKRKEWHFHLKELMM